MTSKPIEVIGRTVSHHRILERLGGEGEGVVNKVEETASDVETMPNGTGEPVFVDRLGHALPRNLSDRK